MISKLSLFIFFLFFDGVRTVKCTRKVSLIFVQLVSLETWLFGFWNGSFNSTQLEILWSNLDSKLYKQTMSWTVNKQTVWHTCNYVTCFFISSSSCWYIRPLSYPGNQYASAFIAIWKNQLFSIQNIREVNAKVLSRLSTTRPQSSTTESLISLFKRFKRDSGQVMRCFRWHISIYTNKIKLHRPRHCEKKRQQISSYANGESVSRTSRELRAITMAFSLPAF